MAHLALITTSYADHGRGEAAAGAFVADFCDELSRHLPLTVLAPGDRHEVVQRDEVVVRRFAVPRLPLSSLSASRPQDWPAIVRTLGAGRRALRDAARESRFDHILALWALPSGYWAETVGREHAIPYSTWALGSDIWQLGRIPLVRSVLRRVLRRATHRFADGYELAQQVEALCGRPCAFLPSTRRIDPGRGKTLAASPPYKLAYLGRWHPNKGTDLLMHGLALLNDDDWASIRELRIFGGGPLADTVAAHCDRLQRHSRPVVSGGYLDREGASDLLRWADYLLIPSRHESIPVVFSDAMKAACPVICTPVGDLPRLVREFDVGILADAVSAESFARALRAALHASPARLGAGLGRAAASFDIGTVATALLSQLALDRGSAQR
jgi:glycosyltransferase involved in cell wall biosynthesis